MTTKEWYNKNKDKAKKKSSEYYYKNRDKINAKRNADYALKPPEELEKLKEYKKRYYEKNREKLKLAAKEHYQNNRESALARQKEYTQENYHRVRLTAVKRRAKQSGVPFDLDLDYLKSLPMPNTCPVLGIPMDGSYRDNHISLDRVIPELGYTKGNVCFISGRANLLKNDASLNEVRKILEYMESWITP